MKKTIFKIVSLFLAVVLVMGICMTGCGNKSELIGTWVAKETNPSYPDIFTLSGDGTGSGDGFSLNWTADGETIKMTIMLGYYEYKYEIKDGKLYLTLYDEELNDYDPDGPYIYTKG